ncbi:hypothetical protein [Croceicoccus bisphenolivorans]|uniref:hypothetical protein n=1 Tax=Croceicoccus bisphenolivorans TaxID=1783232 RepID=UPI00083597E6|nr:hypothetical protein [Croceicoccus bisphenolivorans]
MTAGRIVPVLALLLAGSSLTGCVAAAIPVMASGVMAKRTVDSRNAPAAAPATGQAPELVDVKPSLPAAGGGAILQPNWTEDFMAVALFAAESMDNGLSVLPDPGAREGEALVLPCEGQPPAILVDLDPGDIAFQPGDALPVPASGLGPALATARMKGIAVLWTSVLDESRAGEIRQVLTATGLDPAGSDTLLLTRDPAETKTARRNAVSGDWCIKAIVGDRRGDFDDLMDYLRNPQAPSPFDPLIGNGWFELPPPLAYAA